MNSHDVAAAVKTAMREEREAADRTPLKTLDDVRALSQEEVIARKDEIDAVLDGSASSDAADA